MINEAWTEVNKMKHEQWSVDWRKWDKNMINEVDDVTFHSLSLTTLQAGQK